VDVVGQYIPKGTGVGERKEKEERRRGVGGE